MNDYDFDFMYFTSMWEDWGGDPEDEEFDEDDFADDYDFPDDDDDALELGFDPYAGCYSYDC